MESFPRPEPPRVTCIKWSRVKQTIAAQGCLLSTTWSRVKENLLEQRLLWTTLSRVKALAPQRFALLSTT